MARPKVPRWMNVLWLVFLCCLTGAYIAVAVLRGYDLLQTVGFLGANFGTIFGLAVLAGLALYALSFALQPPDQRKAHDSGEDDHSGDMANLVP